MQNQFSRTEILLGPEAMSRLARAHIAIFGLGGVGSYVAEALVRSGVGSFELIDDDCVSLTNLNRQLLATHASLGQPKVEVMKERMLSINPQVKVQTRRCFFLPENQDSFNFHQYSYVVDAVDTIAAKVALVLQAQAAGVPIISCMGTGNKLHPELLQVADIYKTSVCPLARVMRQLLKKQQVKHLKVVYSQEEPLTPQTVETKGTSQHPLPGSTAFVPATAGLLMAAEIVRELSAPTNSGQ